MPFVNRTNNRVLPANARAADVAQGMITALTPVERTRYAAAFAVGGYPGILYSALTCGTQCYCKASGQAINSRLGKDGTAPIGTLNEMLTSGLEFGVRPYGQTQAPQPTYNPNDTASVYPPPSPLVPSNTAGTWVIDQTGVEGSYLNTRTDLPSVYEDDGLNTDMSGPPAPNAARPFDHFTKDPSQNPGATVVDSGVGPNGVIPVYEFEDLPINGDMGMGGLTDVNCPICMGTGFVNGFNVLNGLRLMLTFQDPSFTSDGSLIFEGPVPEVECTTASWTVVLPNHVVGVDAFRVWDRFKVIGAGLQVDGNAINYPTDLIPYCTGGPHTITVNFGSTTTFSHVELQVNQASEFVHFALPKLSKGNIRSLLENTSDFSVTVSPMVPMIRPGDVIAESGYNKVLQVTSVTGWNTRAAAILGWSCEVHPVQPQDLLNLLPRRRPLATPNAQSRVRTNISGPRRT